MKAIDIAPEDRHTPAHCKSYIEGWLEKTLIVFNNSMKKKGWEPIEIVSQRVENTLCTRTIVFSLQGEAYPLQFFLDKVKEWVDE